jgi:glycosyltransferase involved in cell wall biosynthesis
VRDRVLGATREQPMMVSIALASYNGELFIGEQLKSFAQQSRAPDEVVICDDGSTDGTCDIVEAFAASAPFAVRLNVNPARLGYSGNFERAVSLCSGDIIFLSDQDDVWFAEKLERVIAEFKAHPTAHVVVNDQLIADAELRTSGITKLANLAGIGRSSDHLIEGCCTAIRRNWGDMLLPIPRSAEPLLANGMLAYDRWLNELAIHLAVRRVIDRPLQLFRRHAGNATSWVLSEPRRIGLTDLVKARSKDVPVAAWQRRIDALNYYEQWITCERSALNALGVFTADRALAAVREERRCLAERIALTKAPLSQRLVKVARLYSQGGYDYFHGWKSALRDISRTSRACSVHPCPARIPVQRAGD